MHNTAAAPPWRLPPTADPSVKMVRSESHFSMAATAAVRMTDGSSDLLEMPSSSANMVVEFCACHGGLVERLSGSLSCAAEGRRDSRSLPSLAQLRRVFRCEKARFHG